MNRADNRIDVVARVLAFAASVGLTSLLVGVHAADPSTLGGRDVTTQQPAAIAAARHVNRLVATR